MIFLLWRLLDLLCVRAGPRPIQAFAMDSPRRILWRSPCVAPWRKFHGTQQAKQDGLGERFAVMVLYDTSSVAYKYGEIMDLTIFGICV